MTTPSTSEQSELAACPLDLIVFKWAETLSTGEQSVLLISSLKRLQSAITSRAAVATPHHKHRSIWTVRTDGKKNPCDCVCQCEHSMGEHIRPGEHYWYEDCAAEDCPCVKFTAAPPVDAEAPDVLDDERVDKELRRWQDAIRDKLIDLGAPDYKIDGAGCDSGDPLDFTLAEVGQGIGYFVDQLELVRAASTADEGAAMERRAVLSLIERFQREPNRAQATINTLEWLRRQIEEGNHAYHKFEAPTVGFAKPEECARCGLPGNAIMHLMARVTPSLPSAPEDASMTPEQLERARLIAESRGIDLPTAEELVYLRDRVAALTSVPPSNAETHAEEEPLTRAELADIEHFQQQRRQSPVPQDAWLYVAEIDRLLAHIRIRSAPLCVVHAALEDRDELDLEICNDCVACSLNQRSELLAVLEPYAPAGASWDPKVVLQRSLKPLPSVVPTGDEYQPCPDPRCNDHLGASPMPQCVTAVFWSEEASAIADVVRQLSDQFNRIDNGHCTICRQFRLYDTRSKMQPCENADCLSHRISVILENYEKPSGETLERMKQRCLERITATPVVPEGEQDGEIVAALNKHLAQRHEELATHMRKVCAQAIELIEQYTRPDFYMWLLHDHAGQKSDPFKRAAEARALLQELIDSQPGKGREHGRS